MMLLVPLSSLQNGHWRNLGQVCGRWAAAMLREGAASRKGHIFLRETEKNRRKIVAAPTISLKEFNGV